MVALSTIFGIILLTYGRKVFWLFIGVLGYASGLFLAEEIFHAPHNISFVLAIIFGIGAALLAIFLQKAAIGLAGLLAGASLASILMQSSGFDFSKFSWLVILIGAILGTVLLLTISDWALIILSSLIGARMILEASTNLKISATLFFILLTIIGIGVQTRTLHKNS